MRLTHTDPTVQDTLPVRLCQHLHLVPAYQVAKPPSVDYTGGGVKIAYRKRCSLENILFEAEECVVLRVEGEAGVDLRCD